MGGDPLPYTSIYLLTSQGAMPMLIWGPQGNNEEACTVYVPYQTKMLLCCGQTTLFADFYFEIGGQCLSC